MVRHYSLGHTPRGGTSSARAWRAVVRNQRAEGREWISHGDVGHVPSYAPTCPYCRAGVVATEVVPTPEEVDI